MDPWSLSQIGKCDVPAFNISQFITATSPAGGHIARIPRFESENRDLYIFDCNGRTIVQDYFSPIYKVVGAAWTSDMRLVIVMENSSALIYHVNDTPRRMIELIHEEDVEESLDMEETREKVHLKSVHFFSQNVCCLTEDNDIYIVEGVGDNIGAKAAALPREAKEAEIKILGIQPNTCNSSRSTSVIVSVCSGVLKGMLFVVTANSLQTRVLIPPGSEPFTYYSLHPMNALSVLCNNEILIVSDNDFKYPIIKCNFHYGDEPSSQFDMQDIQRNIDSGDGALSHSSSPQPSVHPPPTPSYGLSLSNLFPSSRTQSQSNTSIVHPLTPASSVHSETPFSPNEHSVGKNLSEAQSLSSSARSLSHSLNHSPRSNMNEPSSPSAHPSSVFIQTSRVSGVYWTNDDTVGVVVKRLLLPSAFDILTISVFGGNSIVQVPHSLDHCLFQQEIDGIRVIAFSDNNTQDKSLLTCHSTTYIARKNKSQILPIPSHHILARSFSHFDKFFLSEWMNDCKRVSECVSELEKQYTTEDVLEKEDLPPIKPSLNKCLLIQIPQEILIETIQEMLHYCEWDCYNPSLTQLLSALKHAIKFISNHDQMKEFCNKLCFTCANIRVLHNLRQYGLLMTYAEYTALTIPVVLSRLLQLNEHALAIQICNIFNRNCLRNEVADGESMNEYRGLITMDWATKKILASNEVATEQLAFEVFTHILRIGNVPIVPIILSVYFIRPQLAIQLLLLEEDSVLAVACLLKLFEYKEAMKRALESDDTDLIFSVITYCGHHMDNREVYFDLISESARSEQVFLKYYRETDNFDLLKEYYIHNYQHRSVIHALISEAVFFSQANSPSAISATSSSKGNEASSEKYNVLMTEYDSEEVAQLLIYELQKVVDAHVAGVTDFEAECIRSQIRLLEVQLRLSTHLINLSLYNTILNLLARKSEDSDKYALHLKRCYGISDLRFEILQMFAFARTNNWIAVKSLFDSKKNSIPIEFYLRATVSRQAFSEGEYYLKSMNVVDDKALALHYALLLNNWKLATRLAIELNDYSSIIAIMDNVDDQPDLRMTLFNYIRDSGYERDSPWVNDVKYHPVLKQKKAFVNGILSAFGSSASERSSERLGGIPSGNDSHSFIHSLTHSFTPLSPMPDADDTSTPIPTAKSLINRFKKKRQQN